MAFCKNCGANIPDGATFCTSCGTPVSDTASQAKTAYQQNGTEQQYNNVYNTTVMPDAADAADAEQNKAMGILSYIGILVLIPILTTAKTSKFTKFHATQGVTNSVFAIAYGIVAGIIRGILALFLSWSTVGIYSLVSSILGLGSIFFLVLMIIGIVNAAQGQMKELPLIGKIDILGIFMK